MAEMVTDSVYHHVWRKDNTMICRHPDVIRRYTWNGEDCILPVCLCLQCKYAERFPYCGAVRCGYGKGENIG